MQISIVEMNRVIDSILFNNKVKNDIDTKIYNKLNDLKNYLIKSRYKKVVIYSYSQEDASVVKTVLLRNKKYVNRPFFVSQEYLSCDMDSEDHLEVIDKKRLSIHKRNR